MEYLIVENNVITNIIVCDNDDIAAKFGALPSYEGAAIGKPYQPAANQLDRIEAQITYTAIMTDTLLEG